MHSLRILAASVTLLVAGCAPSAATPVPTLIVMTPGGEAGLSQTSTSIDLFLSFPNGALSKVTSAPQEAGVTTVHLYSLGGQTGRAINSYVFGEAPAAATRVVLLPGNAVGQIRNRLYVVGLPGKDLNPDDLEWRFLDGGDDVIEQGSGIR